MIELSGITLDYGAARPALDGVSVAFEPGRFTVLLGPSGAGKSSLLRLLNGLVTPTAGTVLVDGRPLPKGRGLAVHRRHTAMIFQQHHLLLRATALDNVVIGRLGHLGRWHAVLPMPRRDRLLALAALDRVGLADKALVRAGRLSGGEQQRVGIARALVQQPRILLADEPVASLDPATAGSIMSLLARITREDGLTAVVSLHQVDLAVRHADAVIGLHLGRIVYRGGPADLDAPALARIYATAPAADARDSAAMEDRSGADELPMGGRIASTRRSIAESR